MADTPGPCSFLGLPIELRNIIYIYLLSTKYTREDKIKRKTITDREYTGDYYLQTHTYHFQTAILRCNHQINEEATIIFHNTNLFVSIEDKYGFLEEKFNEIDFPILARHEKARAFKGYAMEVYLGSAKGKSSSGMSWNSERSPNFMIASEDLHDFCKRFLKVMTVAASLIAGFDSVSHDVMLLINVLHMNGQRNGPPKHLTPAIRKLLDPLCYLHNIKLVKIKCQAPQEYVSAVTQMIRRKAPSAHDLNNILLTMNDEAHASLLKGDFQSAALQYETALNKLHAGSQRRKSKERRMTDGRCVGVRIGKLKLILAHEILLGLAKANFQLHHYEMAHHWTHNVVHKAKVGRHLLSQLWYYRALASRRLGEFDRALGELRNAGNQGLHSWTFLRGYLQLLRVAS